jgi:hypothetical protein
MVKIMVRKENTKMKDDSVSKVKFNEEDHQMVELYYKKIMRILEYYVLCCFILITFVPLLNFSWVQAFTKFIYLTGFPLLIIIFIISLFKEAFQNLIVKIIEK